MFGIVRLVIRIAFVMLIGLLVLAFFTNPTKEEFSEEVKKQLNQKVENETNNPALSYIAEMGLEFSDQVAEKLVTRKNYFVCSIYTAELPDGEYRYLGAFHMFYPLQDKNPFDVFTSK